MQTNPTRAEWTMDWDEWASKQVRQFDLEMRRRIFVKAATSKDEPLRDALVTLVATAHAVAEEMKKRDVEAAGLTERDVELLARDFIAVVDAVPSPNRRDNDDCPF